MESNWRYFVPYMGMVQAFYEYLAMLRTSTPDLYGFIGKRSDNGSAFTVFAYPDELPSPSVTVPKLAPHFPFGYDVYPDAWFLEWPPP